MNIHLKSIASAITFNFLFYSKSFGLNLFLISILVVTLLSTLRTDKHIPKVFAFTYIISAIFVFVNPTGFTIFVHFMAFLVFVGKSISPQSSLYLSWLLGGINICIAWISNYIQKHKTDAKKEAKGLSPKLLNRLKGFVIASILLVLFAMLYKNANPVFENLITKIDLDFISLPWLLFTIAGYILFLNILRPLSAQELVAFDLAQNNELEHPKEIILIQAKKKLQSEHTLGSIVFLALNLLLVVFLVTDLIYLVQQSEITNSQYSEAVHQGVYALMFSVVCAIILILYFFRGNLNFFKGNGRIKKLTYLWIGLNFALILFTTYKNYIYVETLGLTYKRIGVFIYLTLTLTGLITAYIKVAQVKNFIFLLRSNIATIFIFLILSAAVPWDKVITSFNLNSLDLPDIAYLVELDETNSVQLYNYAKKNTSTLDSRIRGDIEAKYAEFQEKQAKKTWQEFTIHQLTENLTK
ncbi:DUF4153 domain-containing protein [Maribacter cobaltidurans]|uniref:Uncharacterized protein n=1 Tax=Maribacter cobaltidurans TaxID=1178778 RepID=A0A223V203_9FLAO|nr:DUF4153 domain-containing protein [Maribacter cobaltidurans]ASV29286.1 hypothetical protein CJ263_03090 [Maribacter cobaltidurans]GGD70329.1 hypothetical protein GCM10011412_04880 [Maribacter cobaltidurans]